MADPRYALVQDDLVHQLDVPAEWLDIPNMRIIDVSSASGVAEGWIVASDDSVSAPPPPVQPAQTIFSPRDFVNLFTPAEQTSLFTARRTSVQIDQFITLAMAGPVDIGNPEVIADVNAVAQAGIITSARAAQILAGTAAPTSPS